MMKISQMRDKRRREACMNGVSKTKRTSHESPFQKVPNRFNMMQTSQAALLTKTSGRNFARPLEGDYTFSV